MKKLVAPLLILFGLLFSLPALAVSIPAEEWFPDLNQLTVEDCTETAIDGIDPVYMNSSAIYLVSSGTDSPPIYLCGKVAGPYRLAAAPFEVGWRLSHS